MNKQLPTYLLLLFLLMFVEFVFLGNHNIINLFLGGILVYFGMKRERKWILYVGLAFLAVALLSVWSLRLLLFIFILHALYLLWKGTPPEQLFRPIQTYEEETPNGIWKNKLFSFYQSPFRSYEWEDVHISGFYGQTIVDVTNTVLPKQTSFISIRQTFGQVKIEIPYEVPARIHFSTVYGEAKILHHQPQTLMNETLHFKDGYDTKRVDSPELIISVSLFAGSFEVIRK